MLISKCIVMNYSGKKTLKTSLFIFSSKFSKFFAQKQYNNHHHRQHPWRWRNIPGDAETLHRGEDDELQVVRALAGLRLCPCLSENSVVVEENEIIVDLRKEKKRKTSRRNTLAGFLYFYRIPLVFSLISSKFSNFGAFYEHITLALSV